MMGTSLPLAFCLLQHEMGVVVGSDFVLETGLGPFENVIQCISKNIPKNIGTNLVQILTLWKRLNAFPKRPNAPVG